MFFCRGLKSPLSPGREKRGGTDSDRDSELELDYSQCKYIANTTNSSYTVSALVAHGAELANSKCYTRAVLEPPTLHILCAPWQEI